MSFFTIWFIFSNSLDTRDESNQRSDAIVDQIKPIVDPDNSIPRPRFNHYVRKAAHFTEFAALGFSLMGLVAALMIRKDKWKIPAVMLTALAIASADETLQFFSEGRGPGVTDVLIDFSGAVFGLLVMLLYRRVIQKLNNKMKNHHDR